MYLLLFFFLIGSGNPGHQSNQGHQDREVCQDAKGTFLCVPVLKVMFGKVHSQCTWVVRFAFVCRTNVYVIRWVWAKEKATPTQQLTVVYGNDLVNISFLNFQAVQDGYCKVTTTTGPSPRYHVHAIAPSFSVLFFPLSTFASVCSE